MYTVSVVLIILGGINSTLSGDGVSPSWGILITEAIDIIAKLSEGGGAEPPARPEPTTITRYFRLFAGFTNLEEKRWLSHFSESGPSGIFESSFISLVCLGPYLDTKGSEKIDGSEERISNF